MSGLKIKNLAIQISDPNEKGLKSYFRLEGENSSGVDVLPRKDGNFYVQDICNIIPQVIKSVPSNLLASALQRVDKSVDAILVNDREEITVPFRETIKTSYNDVISRGALLVIIFVWSELDPSAVSMLLDKGRKGEYPHSGRPTVAPTLKLPPSKFKK